MNLRIFADLDKNILNEFQKKIIENVETLLYASESSLYLHTGFCINEINDEFVDGRLGSKIGLVELIMYFDGKFEFRISGHFVDNSNNNINDQKSIEYFKECVKSKYE